MKNKGGRPRVINESVLDKLEEVFALGGTDEEACLFANIAVDTLYKYQRENPEYIKRKEELKETPILKARRTVIDSLDKPEMAFRFLERKRKKEFGPNVDMTSDGEKITFGVINYADDNNSISTPTE